MRLIASVQELRVRSRDAINRVCTGVASEE